MSRIKWFGKKKFGKPGNFKDDWSTYYPPGYPGGQRKSPVKKGRRGLIFRTVFTLLLLAVLLTAREVQLPVGQQVRDTVRYLLTAEWNFEPLLQGTVRVAGQILNWDNPTFNNWPNTRTAQPVSGDTVVADGLWMPVSGKVIREFGWLEDSLDGMSRFHPGVDIEAEPGTPVRAVMDGQVAKTGEDSRLGKFVLLRHGSGSYTLYAGLKNILPEEGQWISAGQEVGEVSEDSDVPGGGLHFEMRENNELVDPLQRLHVDR